MQHKDQLAYVLLMSELYKINWHTVGLGNDTKLSSTYFVDRNDEETMIKVSHSNEDPDKLSFSLISFVDGRPVTEEFIGPPPKLSPHDEQVFLALSDFLQTPEYRRAMGADSSGTYDFLLPRVHKPGTVEKFFPSSNEPDPNRPHM